ncbi:MAG: Pilin assembly protein [Parcubacteria group bacterium GW2011_GWC2_39_11]|nr:MAG: Pilin assembly protein [Parcubacteria group bacterium GW2011_GWC2_39_11]
MRVPACAYQIGTQLNMFLIVNRKKENGFSLIELLTVMAIMGILAVIVLPNYFVMQKRLALSRSVQKLAHDIRRAQEMAMSANEEPGCSAGYPDYKFSYGVYFSLSAPDSYKIFADCDSNKDYNSPADKIVNTITFEKTVTLSNLSPVVAGSLGIVFTPPAPAVTISPNSSTAEITITNGNENKSVKINMAGLIDD